METAHGADRTAGPAREGTALLQGLAICGRCGRQMTARYHTRRGVQVPDYQCMTRYIQDGGQRCQTIPGATVDAAVGALPLDIFTPHALEVALIVQAELATRAAEADALRRSHVERARLRAPNGAITPGPVLRHPRAGLEPADAAAVPTRHRQ